RELARALAGEPGAHLILHGRSPERLARLAAELAPAPARVTTVRADLAELAQVRALAREIAAASERIDVLVNNAGVGFGAPDPDERTLTVDGNELRFAVNYLAPFLLTRGLLDRLEAAAPARIVNVASIGQADVDFDDPTLAAGYDGRRAYGQSKLALIMDTLTLAARLPAERVTANSLHPGTFMPTKIVLESIGHSVDSLETGVATTLRLIGSPELDGVSGRFFDRFEEARARDQAYDAAARERLLELSERLTGAPR
ncbi:MAG TPA: SDR family NAD(P)-dependent oxidoreductase, partial [Solirubrobacteraceae bacterium]|nr:SDR family NAD(P)-dependent oxidoreductase [Solirubrobacteraceae bacterium]